MPSNQANGTNHLSLEGSASGVSKPTANDSDVLSMSSVTVMIVDKEQLVADLLASVIRSFGFNVLGVFTNLEPFAQASTKNPSSLAVLDARIPEVPQVTRILMSLQPCTAFVFMDDVFRNHQLNRALDCCAAGYLTKQDSLENLEVALRGIAAGVRSFPASLESHRGKRCSRNPALLTDREIEVLRLLASGLTIRRCAAALGISVNTVENHKAQIVRKVDVHRTSTA